MSLSLDSKKLQSHSSQQDQQPGPVCTWSVHAPQSGPSKSPFPRYYHAISATATAAGELFLFGGYAYTNDRYTRNDDLYVISTRDFSTTLLQTSGEVPSPRAEHTTALNSANLLIWGGNVKGGHPDDSLRLLNLASRKWTRIVPNGLGPGRRYLHTGTMVGSKFFVFGGQIAGGGKLNDIWALDLNSLKPQPVWESYEPTPGNKKPLPRSGHVSVTTEDHIIVFGGCSSDKHYHNDTWSFKISTRKWTELRCTGSIPSPRRNHAATLVDDVMYVFGGYTGKTCLDDSYALQLSTQRWFKFHNVGTSPVGRLAHAMASDGTRVFVLGGDSNGAAKSDYMSLIHVFDTKHIKYPEPERNAVNPNKKTMQIARKSSTGLLTQEQSQITHERNPCPNGRPLELSGMKSKPRRVPEDDAGEGSTEYHAKFVAPHSSEGELARLELERQLSVSLAAQTERERRVTRLTDELALKNTLLEQSEASATEVSKRAGLELRKHADRLLTQTSLGMQKDAELVNLQARLDELLLSRDQQIEQYEKELENLRAKLKTNESELEAVRLRLTDAEKGWTKSRAEADTLRAQTATGSVNRDEDQATNGLMERLRALEAEVASKRWNEKSIQEMECRNEG